MEYKNENRTCQNCKKDFTIEPDDFSFYEKIKVPAPTFCPYCRMMRRMVFGNLSTFYKKSVIHVENLLFVYILPMGTPECIVTLVGGKIIGMELNMGWAMMRAGPFLNN
jgi:hypothetical protein